MKIQLCYASKRVEQHQDLLMDLSDILTTARHFNAQHKVYGVLYYAEGMYFQCLEGEQNVVEPLFEHIQQDLRHTDVLRFKDICIEEVHFSEWSMKYVSRYSQIARFFSQAGFDSFSHIHWMQMVCVILLLCC